MSDRPAGIGANCVEAATHRLVDVLGLVGVGRGLVEQLDDRRLLAQRLFGLLALGDVGED